MRNSNSDGIQHGGGGRHLRIFVKNHISGRVYNVKS